MTTKAIYPLRERWHLFQPYLSEADVVQALAGGMGYVDASEWDQDNDPPWARTHTDYWMNVIDGRIENDPEFIAETDALYQTFLDRLGDEDKASDAYFESEEHDELEQRYHRKHSPKKGDIEYYQWKHACHWVVDFVYTLLLHAMLDADGWGVWTTETHSVAYFVKDDVVYFVDILNEWNSVDELEAFMGESISL